MTKKISKNEKLDLIISELSTLKGEIKKAQKQLTALASKGTGVERSRPPAKKAKAAKTPTEELTPATQDTVQTTLAHLAAPPRISSGVK
jgi:hypothetical protein